MRKQDDHGQDQVKTYEPENDSIHDLALLLCPHVMLRDFVIIILSGQFSDDCKSMKCYYVPVLDRATSCMNL